MDDEEFTVYCCGLDRPPAPEYTPRVRLTGTAEGGVITIGDRVTCVHAMLERHLDDLLQARDMWYEQGGEPDARPDEIIYVDPKTDLRRVTLQGERDTDISGWEGEQSQEDLSADKIRITVRYVTI